MSRSLPPRPSWDHLQKESKAIVCAHLARDASVLPTLRRLHRFAEAGDAEIFEAEVALHDAQFALAIEYGFSSWAAMKEHVLAIREATAQAGGSPAGQQSPSARTGGCFCGNIRYEISGQLLNQTVCHCPGCKKSSGAAALAWLTVRTCDFKLKQGQLAEIRSERYPKSSCDGAGGVRTFCPKCGTPISFKGDGRCERETDVTVGSLDDPKAFKSTQDVFAEYKLDA